MVLKKFALATMSVMILSPVLSMSAAANTAVSSGDLLNRLDSVTHSDVQMLETCMDDAADTGRAIRACTKALRTVRPDNAIRSTLYARRGILHLSDGKLKRATRDFKDSNRLSESNELALLGQGYSALLTQDYAQAQTYFNDCANQQKTAPLALYGRAISKEMLGDVQGAYADYQHAAALRPDWTAPQTQLERFVKK